MRITDHAHIYLPVLLFGFTLQWIDVGPLPISQIASLLVVFAFFSVNKKIYAGRETSIFASYFLFIVIMIIGTFWSEDPLEGSKAIARSSIYLFVAFVIYALLRALPYDRCVNALANSIFFVAPAFVIVFWIASIRSGVDVGTTAIQAVSTGNPNLLQFQLFRVVLNNGEVDPEGYSSAARHGIMVSLATVAHLHLLLRRNSSVAGNTLCAVTYFLVFFSLSRSAIFGLVLGYACIVLTQVASGKFQYQKYLFVFGFVALFFVSYQNFSATGLFSILSDRFVYDIVDNPRVHEFFQILAKINERVIFGWGTGTHLKLSGLDAQYPHNFILYAWHQLGLVGLIVSFAFIGMLTLLLAEALSRSIRAAKGGKSHESKAFLLSAVLMCIVLVRVMFAKAGLLAVPEWVALVLSIYAYKYGLHSLSYSRNANTVPGT